MTDTRLRLIFAGTPEFAAIILQKLLTTQHDIIAVYTQPDKPAGRGQKMVSSAVKTLALQHQLPVFQPPTLRTPEAQAQLKTLAADVMIVAAYGLILPQAVLDTPRYGCINVHGSLLPRWRGAAPIHRALLAGDKETGITIMQMEAGLDTGPMLRKVHYSISETDTTHSVHDQLAQLGAEALIATLNDLSQGRLQPEKQDDALATYAKKIEKEEAKIEWQHSAEDIARKIRAFNAWPVAYTLLGDIALKIWTAQVIENITFAEPGTILHADKRGIDVATGHGILRLCTLQLPGHKAMAVIDMLNGHADLFSPGTQLR
jgi:methionyl-tRNA formyltransferase